MSATARTELHRLVDQLPDGTLTDAYAVLEALRNQAVNDDEVELTPAEERGVHEALAALQRGDGRPAEEVFARWRKLVE